MKHLIFRAATAAICTALYAVPALAEDFIVADNVDTTGSLVQSNRAVSFTFTSTRAVSGARIFVPMFVPTQFQARVTAYLVRNLGSDNVASDEVARGTFTLAASSIGWNPALSNLTLPAGTYHLVLLADSASAWQFANAQPRLAPGFSVGPARVGTGAIAYPPARSFAPIPEPLGIVITTDADYFAAWQSISSLHLTFSGMNASSAITHSRPGLAGPFRWTTTGTLPPGINLVGDERTGALRLEGTPPANALFTNTTFSIALTDQASGRTLNQTVTVTNRPVTLSNAAFTWYGFARAGIAGQRYSEPLQIPYGGTPPYSYSVTGELPTGLTLNPDTGEVSGTASRAGNYSITSTVRDSAARTLSSGTITLTIDPGTAIADNRNTGTSTIIHTVAGAEFDQTLGIGIGVTGFAPYLSTLPPGLTLTAAGRLSGRVTTAGVYGFCVTGQSTIQSIVPLTGRVVRCFNLVAIPPRAATFTALPAASLGSAYNQALFTSLTGGVGAYFYEVLNAQGQPVANNVVAPGITLNAQGRLTGTPTAAGTYPVRVRVRDYSSSWMNGTTSEFTAPSPLTVAVDSTLPAISGVTNGASFGTGGIAAGEIITLFGANLGPAELATLTLTNGRVSTTLAGTRVTVNNIAAPLIYTSAGQVSAIVPYGATGANASIVVTYNNRTTAAFTTPIVPASPALFTRDGSGKGLPAALNQDGSIHGADQPAAPGSVLVLYGTGEGQTQPGGTDGALATGSTLPRPVRALTVTIGGKTAEVLYAGAAPGLVAGVFQINVRVPADVEKGEMVPLVVQSGGNLSSPAGTYINVQ